ncbi:MAG: LytTR family DNA-binding domain-containing protein [Bacteroidota bacterium]
MQIWSFLKTPFSRPERNRRHLLWVIFLGLSCSLFIILFQPFGIQNVNDQWYYNLVVLSMGLVFISAYLLLEWGIPSLFPQFFEQWTLGKAILWYALLILFIGAALFWYKSFLAGYSDFTVQEYFFVIGRTFLIALIVSFFSLGLYQYFSRKTISLFSNSEDYLITSSTGQSLSVNPSDILYISSDDNYVEIHYLVDDKRKKELFRSSLKNIEAQLVNPLSPIFRCHRRYLINIERFSIVKSTSRRMLLSLMGSEDEVPVSHQYVETIKQYLSVRP